jgi:chromosome segregation ATPase
MARGGINKSLVMDARNTLLAKGVNPSIDAVRVELGNTGSKSTIHRYLREIEEESTSKLDNEASISESIKTLIGQISHRLMEEARAVVADHEQQNQRREQSLMEQIVSLKSELQRLNELCETNDSMHKGVLAELNTAKRNETALRDELAHTATQLGGLKAVAEEKDKRIATLEEKHRHNREALEHYRDSVMQQRDQDQRRQEQHVQQLQSEIRALNQTLSVKQANITQLNKENGRLAAELGATQKTATALEFEQRKLITTLEAKGNENEALSRDLVKFEAQGKELDKIIKINSELQASKSELLVSIGKLESEIVIKSDMINRLLNDKNTEM